MTIKKLAKKACINPPDEIKWPYRFPTDVFGYRKTECPKGSPIDVGDRLHNSMQRHFTGGWIFQEYFAPCKSILEILEDLGLPKKSLQSEMPLRSGHLRGRVDLFGRLADGRSCIIEIKTTLGDHGEPPCEEDIIQMGAYANMERGRNPVLICLRVVLKENSICVFRLDESEDILKQVRARMYRRN